MNRRLLVDGYNVIHADPELAPLVTGDLELARIRLIERLARFARNRSMEVTVVFDGSSGHAKTATSEEMLGITVMFSPGGTTADSVLESLAVAAERPELVTVATSDRATQEAIFGRGALRMSARELVAALDEPDDETPERPPEWRGTVAERLDPDAIDRLRRM
jgi:uncharacterized protein